MPLNSNFRKTLLRRSRKMQTICLSRNVKIKPKKNKFRLILTSCLSLLFANAFWFFLAKQKEHIQYKVKIFEVECGKVIIIKNFRNLQECFLIWFYKEYFFIFRALQISNRIHL